MGGIVGSKPEHKETGDEVEDISVESTEFVESLLPPNSQESEEESNHSRMEARKKKLNEFKEMLGRKREERRLAISRISEEMNNLRQSQEDLEKERMLRIGLEKQVTALKEVSAVSNEMLQLRENQVTELKKRLKMMEAGAEENLTSLRNQYENQIENIRKLRQLYEERAEAAARGHEKELEKERAKNILLELKIDEYAKDIPAKQQLVEKINDLEKQLAKKQIEVDDLKTERSSLIAECHNMTSQLSLINNLFSNMLTGEMDFDLLTKLLQDNHNLISDLIANGEINDTAALLVNIAKNSYKKSENPDDKLPNAANAKEEIASNLPKVWRMLIELLSSHVDSCQSVQGTSDECYKHVNTPNGSRAVISVSQTFLRLKDLILEKNCLVKEVGRLKTLNGHLENRLDLQEKRLSVVTSELRKTWGVVSKLKVQHRQLHTHEKVLRYELQHKRHMLTDLKQELEYCKETWDKVREKNTQTEHDWEVLRKEFMLRKSRDASNSTESGYEDDENSQSPDVSASDSEYDLSALSDVPKASELESELDEAGSDATVIELIDMLEFDPDEPYKADENFSVADDASATRTLNSKAEAICDTFVDSRVLAPSADSVVTSSPGRSSEEILNARAARLRRLEQQCRSLLNQMALTSLRSDTLSTRLEELHEQYSSEERRVQPGQTAQADLPTEHDGQTEQIKQTEQSMDERSNRVQKMERTCLEMFENITAEENTQLRLENVCDKSAPEEQSVSNVESSESDTASEPLNIHEDNEG